MPKRLTTDEMREYQRRRRALQKNVNPAVKPVKPECKAFVEGVKPIENVKPDVKPCRGCSDRDMANKILRAKLLASERQVELLKRDIPKKPDSPYRFGPERSLNG